MDKNKYFTPDIEDIRVGYECEILSVNGKAWLSTTITEWCPGCQMEALRTPFLTKEQIQAEGWIGSNQNFDVEGFHKNNFFASYNFQTRMLGIIVKDPSKSEWLEVNAPKYVGECKDINTFRYICKLLKIN